MRITAGEYGGRILKSPKNKAIRPTSDKIRQAIFNSLLQYDKPRGSYVIDGFCGTGALGLEALSRGAAYCIFIDRARSSLALVQENIATLSSEDDRNLVLKRDLSIPGSPPKNVTAADLAFLDPPYGQGLSARALSGLSDHKWLAPGAICVVETEKDVKDDIPEGFQILDDRLYGQTRVRFLLYGTQG